MANYTYLDNTGIIITDTADIKEAVQSEYQAAFGADISLEDSTPQGRLIDIETNARTAIIENNAFIANSINFNLASGIILDAWGANFNLTRGAATSSTVTATITGVAGTTISAGSQAATNAGDVFYLENNVSIPNGGSVTATFLSLEKGAIPCPVGSLTKIIDGTLGWETINNTSAATLGVLQESDSSFKQRFYDAGLFGGSSLIEDYKNALMNVANVQSSYVRDNGTNQVETYDTVNIAAHSVYACVDGGNDNDVAYALFTRKSSGSAWTAITGQSVTVDVIDPTYNDTYQVTFNRPDAQQIKANIEMDVTTSAVPDPQTAVQNAVYDYINSLAIGEDVLVLQVANAIVNAVPGVKLTTVEIAKVGGSLSTSNITIHINEAAKAQLTNITVTINE